MGEMEQHLKYQRVRQNLSTCTVSEFEHMAREVQRLIETEFNPVYLDSLVHAVLVRGMEILQGVDPYEAVVYARTALRYVTRASLNLQHAWVAATTLEGTE